MNKGKRDSETTKTEMEDILRQTKELSGGIDKRDLFLFLEGMKVANTLKKNDTVRVEEDERTLTVTYKPNKKVTYLHPEYMKAYAKKNKIGVKDILFFSSVGDENLIKSYLSGSISIAELPYDSQDRELCEILSNEMSEYFFIARNEEEDKRYQSMKERLQKEEEEDKRYQLTEECLHEKEKLHQLVEEQLKKEK